MYVVTGNGIPSTPVTYTTFTAQVLHQITKATLITFAISPHTTISWFVILPRRLLTLHTTFRVNLLSAVLANSPTIPRAMSSSVLQIHPNYKYQLGAMYIWIRSVLDQTQHWRVLLVLPNYIYSAIPSASMVYRYL